MAAGREFVLKIVADVKDATKGMETVEKSTGNMRDKVTGIGKSIVGGLAVAGIASFGKAAVDAASDAQQSVGAMSSVFGDFADEMDTFGETTAENMGLTTQEFNQLSAVTGSLLKNAGLPMDQVTESTQELTQRAADLAAMFGTDVSTAVEAMGSSFKGEFDSLEQFGVSLKASDIEARAMAEGYVDASGKVTDAGKAIATQELIMEQSADAAGTFAAESGTLAGQTAIMSAQMSNAQAEMGAKLLPVIVAVMNAMMPLVDIFLQYSNILIPLAAVIGGIVVAYKAYEVGQMAVQVATKAWAAAQWLLNAAMTANPIGIIVAAVAALVAGFVLAYTKVGWFRAGVDAALKGVVAAFEWLLDAAMGVFNWIKGHWPLLLAIITGPFGVAVTLIVKNWDTIKKAVSGAVSAITGFVSNIWSIVSAPFNRARDIIGNAVDKVKEWFRNLPNQIATFFSSVWSKVSQPFRTAKDRIGDTIDGIKNWFRNLPGQIAGFISSISSRITAPFRSAFTSVKNLWNNTVGGFGFTVPSWVPGVGGKGFRIPYMAAGGIVTRPTIALIGEAGPEAVIPLGSSMMTTGGNVTLNVYALTANAEVGRKVYEALREYERTNGRRVV